MKTVIVTAFEPFGDFEENPTQKVLAELPAFLYDAKIIKVTLPVIWNQAFSELLPLIDKHKPALILMLGLAAGRTHVNIERIAINIASSKTADNLGQISHEKPIEKDGPDAYFTNLPLEKIMQRLQRKKVPAALSNTAGTYLCNQIMYQVLHHINQTESDTKAGFIHMPLLPEQVTEKPHYASLEKRHTMDTVLTIIDVLINPVELDLKQL